MSAAPSLIALLLAVGAGAGDGVPLVIAHRGASGLLPEHTLEAVALAHGLGADFVEQDVVLTGDGVPVVLHDVTLDSTTDVAARFPDRRRADGRFHALDFTLAEVKTLRVTERFDPATGERVFPGRFPAGAAEFRVPTLAEELELVGGLNRTTGRTVGVYPELKRPDVHRAAGRDLAAAVLAVLAGHGYRTRTDACFLQCFDGGELRRVRNELGCDLRLVRLVEDVPTDDELRAIAAVAGGLGPPLSAVIAVDADGRDVDTGLVGRAHAAGLSVHPWTARADAPPAFAADFPELHRDLRAAGVDGLFTDFPGRSRRLLRAGP